MRAIFSVRFSKNDMCDKETLKKQFKGSWYKLIKWLYKEEGLGIFNEDFKLMKVVED